MVLFIFLWLVLFAIILWLLWKSSRIFRKPFHDCVLDLWILRFGRVEVVIWSFFLAFFKDNNLHCAFCYLIFLHLFLDRGHMRREEVLRNSWLTHVVLHVLVQVRTHHQCFLLIGVVWNHIGITWVLLHLFSHGSCFSLLSEHLLPL